MSFNWRNYITVEGFEHLRARDGRRPGTHTDESVAHLREVKSLVEQTLDQISALPEVQKLILQSAENGPLRLAHNGDPTRMADPRLRISINADGKTEYDPFQHSISLDTASILQRTYGNPPTNFSLQRVLIHEVGHGAARNFNDEGFLLEEKLAAARTTVDRLLHRFEGAELEFAQSGTIGGLPFKRLLEASSPEEFDKIHDEISMGSGVLFPREVIEERGGRIDQMTPQFGLKDAVSAYFVSSFHLDQQEYIERRDEIPVINNTNQIMQKYYGETAREGHGSRRNTSVPAFSSTSNLENVDFDKVMDAFRTRIHSDILPNIHVAVPVIAGVSYLSGIEQKNESKFKPEFSIPGLGVK